MSTTFTIDTSTSRANPTPAPMKRLTIPALRKAKGGTPLVMLTAYTVRTAQLCWIRTAICCWSATAWAR